MSEKDRTPKRQRSVLTGSEYECPVCFNLLEEAHITKCGHTFCYSCITKTIVSFNRCPTCDTPIESLESLIPNFAVNELVKKRKSQPELNFTSEELSLPDVNAALEALTQRKRLLEAESIASQNRLLVDFLERLLEQKNEQRTRIAREIETIEADLVEATNRLDTVVESNELVTRRRRLQAHFDDFVESYFTARSAETFFGCDKEESRKRLDEFQDGLIKFSRYGSLKRLASLNYSNDPFNNSTIVSSIEFDKDDEYFAIAGVTKRIKVFEYRSVVDSTVDVHYPCLEMLSKSKISCVSWNGYHKNVLASSDYDGTVAIWDASTGQRTRAFHEHERRCWSVDFAASDARLVASGSDDARVKLYAIDQDRSIATVDAKANVCCVEFNPGAARKLAFGSADHCVHYYDLRNLKEPLALFKGHKKAVSYVKFANEVELVSASTDSQLKVWSVSSPSRSRTLVGHANEKNFVGLATDGDYVACGSEDNSLYVYHKGVGRALFAHRFGAAAGAGIERRAAADDDAAAEFVSAVCWKRTADVIVAANSQGIINVLQLV